MINENVVEEGKASLIKGEEEIYTLEDNASSEKNNKLFININYPTEVDEEGITSIYLDKECKQLFNELKHKANFNNMFSFDVTKGQKFYIKSKAQKEFLFYFKYCNQSDVEQVNNIKEKLKVKMKEDSGKGTIKVEFDSPYQEKDNNFQVKYSIYLSEGGNKNYKIFKEAKLDETKIVEGKEAKYEVELKVDTSKKAHYVYVVAEPKDGKISLRPKIIYTGCKIPKNEATSKSDTIINAILIVLIIITLIYKIIKKRRKYLEQQKTGGATNEKNPLI